MTIIELVPLDGGRARLPIETLSTDPLLEGFAATWEAVTAISAVEELRLWLLGAAEEMLVRAASLTEVALGQRTLEMAGSCDNRGSCIGTVSALESRNDLGRLAAALVKRGRSADAEPVVRRALELADEGLARESYEAAVNAHNLAVLCEAIGLTEEARALWTEARLLLECYAGEHPDNASLR
jgi:hypothetical protein